MQLLGGAIAQCHVFIAGLLALDTLARLWDVPPKALSAGKRQGVSQQLLSLSHIGPIGFPHYGVKDSISLRYQLLGGQKGIEQLLPLRQ